MGRLQVDPLAITGEGGGLVPVLGVPLQVHLFEDDRGLLVLLRLEAALWTDAADRGGRELARPVAVRGIGVGGNLPVVVSQPASFSPDVLPLRFALTQEATRALHDHARAQGTSAIRFELRFQATLARPLDPAFALGRAALNDPVAPGLAPYWRTQVDDMQIELSRERWAESVSPGLGGDRTRLVVVDLPASNGPLGSGPAEMFDAARRAYDAGDYRGCIQKCRDVRNFVERSLRSADDEHVASALARRVGADDDDPRVRFLDAAWTALVNLTSKSHHVETVGRLDGASAHATLLMTATLLQFVGELIEPL